MKNSTTSTKHGLSKLANSNDKAVEILKLAVAGADNTALVAKIEELQATAEEKGEIWSKIAEYFRNLADFNPEIEKGKAVARLNLLLLNSLKIQDYKTALSVQKELSKLLNLYE